MEPTPALPPPEEAWEPLPASEWDREAARHLLLRASFSAHPDRVDALVQAGPVKGLAQLFSGSRSMPVPDQMVALEAEARETFEGARKKNDKERQKLRRAFRQKARTAYNDYAVHWYGLASDPNQSALEKYVLFLQNIFVVGATKVRNPVLLFQHQQLLRSAGLGSYVQLTKQVSRSPAMIRYLDLQQNQRGKPNENFARELFELFTLGEGNYTETDIKESARAFTGYRAVFDRFIFAARQHDDGKKTVFGAKGRWNGDDVIDLIFQQEAAAQFVPNELCRFYLSDDPIPVAYLEALGRAWRRDGFQCGKLLSRFFQSRLFYHPAFRANRIKSPTQFYLGLLQDLELDPQPFPRFTQNLMRQMGQPFYDPPNVRGWVGGQRWINASTLAARRQTVIGAFTQMDEDRLNADEIIEVAAAAGKGRATFSVPPDRFRSLADRPPGEAVSELVEAYLPAPPEPDILRGLIRNVQTAATPEARSQRLRQTATILTLSPYYQLC